MFPLPNATGGIGQIFPYLSLVTNDVFGLFLSLGYVGVLYFSLGVFMKERVFLASTFVGFLTTLIVYAMQLTGAGIPLVMFGLMVFAFLVNLKTTL